MGAPFRLDGRRALVTGGACGIGEATCRALTTAGAKVTIVDVDLSRAESLATQLSGATVLAFDIADETAGHAALSRVEASRVGLADTRRCLATEWWFSSATGTAADSVAEIRRSLRWCSVTWSRFNRPSALKASILVHWFISPANRDRLTPRGSGTGVKQVMFFAMRATDRQEVACRIGVR
jgi:NAD(P)-dependent dehydrogenase (short-subunit alcohol dehydrogenase family)